MRNGLIVLALASVLCLGAVSNADPGDENGGGPADTVSAPDAPPDASDGSAPAPQQPAGTDSDGGAPPDNVAGDQPPDTDDDNGTVPDAVAGDAPPADDTGTEPDAVAGDQPPAGDGGAEPDAVAGGEPPPVTDGGASVDTASADAPAPSSIPDLCKKMVGHWWMKRGIVLPSPDRVVIPDSEFWLMIDPPTNGDWAAGGKLVFWAKPRAGGPLCCDILNGRWHYDHMWGDQCDFRFEYEPRPASQEVMDAVRNLVGSGSEIHQLDGDHTIYTNAPYRDAYHRQT